MTEASNSPFTKDAFFALASWLPPHDMLSLMHSCKKTHQFGFQWLQQHGKSWVPGIDATWSYAKLEKAANDNFSKDTVDLSSAIRFGANVNWIASLIKTDKELKWGTNSWDGLFKIAGRYSEHLNLAITTRRPKVLTQLDSAVKTCPPTVMNYINLSKGFVEACKTGAYDMVRSLLRGGFISFKPPKRDLSGFSFHALTDPLRNWPPWTGVKAAIENHQWSVVRAVLDCLPIVDPKDDTVSREVAFALCNACEENVPGNHKDAAKLLRKLFCAQPSLVEVEELMIIADQVELWNQPWGSAFIAQTRDLAEALGANNYPNQKRLLLASLSKLEPSQKRLKTN